MSNPLILAMQEVLTYNRLYKEPHDGVPTPEFDLAVAAFKEVIGFVRRPYFTGETLKKMDLSPALFRHHPAPWMNEMARYMGYHERTNRTALIAWLKSDGKTLGDPSKLPWCGDAVETALKLTLGLQMFAGNADTALQTNPYWALNWLKFGTPLTISTQVYYGAVAVFERNGGGHVGFVCGIDRARNRILIRGGNQSDRISDAWMDISGASVKLRGLRWPQKIVSGGAYLAEDRVLAPELNSRNNRVETELT